MGLEATTLAAIGLGTSTAATVYGISQNIKQRKAQEQVPANIRELQAEIDKTKDPAKKQILTDYLKSLEKK